MCLVRFFVLLLMIVGSINWGLWGIFQYDLVADLLGGNTSTLSRLVYSLIGISGIFGITFFFSKRISKESCCLSSKKSKSSCCSDDESND